MGGCGLDSSSCGYGSLLGSCEGGRGRSGPTNSWQNSSLAETVLNLSRNIEFHGHCKVIS